VSRCPIIIGIGYKYHPKIQYQYRSNPSFTRVSSGDSLDGCCVGGFGSDYGAGRGGGPVKSSGFGGRAPGPYSGYITHFDKYLLTV